MMTAVMTNVRPTQDIWLTPALERIREDMTRQTMKDGFEDRDLRLSVPEANTVVFYLNKQIPQKAVVKYDVLSCPFCYSSVKQHTNFCSECGQALDY